MYHFQQQPVETLLADGSKLVTITTVENATPDLNDAAQQLNQQNLQNNSGDFRFYQNSLFDINTYYLL